jgi:hypothetical protein
VILALLDRKGHGELQGQKAILALQDQQDRKVHQDR